MKLQAKSKVLFIGDSITDVGRNRNHCGVTSNDDAYGHGYVRLLRSMICGKYPELDIRFVNKGVSGDTIRHLEQRWDEDVIAHKPDWLSIMIGINDVWRQFDCPQVEDAGVDLPTYETTYRNLLSRTRPNLKGLIIAGPYLIEPNAQEPMRAMMDGYSAVAKKMAEEFDGVFVDSQAAFGKFLEHHHPMEIAKDRVHPNGIGHGVIANAFMDAIEA